MKTKDMQMQEFIDHCLKTKEMVGYDPITNQIYVGTITKLMEKYMINKIVFGESLLEAIGEL